MKKIILLSLFSLSLSFAMAQTEDSQDAKDPKTPRVYRPDIPGSFIIDFGFNNALNKPDKFNTSFIASNAFNFYYQYPIRIGKSKFSFNPGAGLSFERFRFTNGVNLSRVGSRYDLLSASTKFGSGASVQKTILAERYFDIPLEFRFDTKPEDVTNSFNVSIGGRFGYLFDSMMKIKYSQNGEKITNKEKQDFGLTKFRYGVYSRVGIGAFNLFFFYNLSPTFKANTGPDKTTMNTFTTGISINGF